MRNIVLIFYILIVLSQAFSTKILAQTKNIAVTYIKQIENQNHPQIGYWLFNKEMLVERKYRQVIDTIAQKSKFDLLFLTCQGKDKVNLFDVKTMHPVLSDLVDYAQKKGIGIGLQFFPANASDKVDLKNSVRMIQEGELLIPESNNIEYTVVPNYIRKPSLLIKNEILKVVAFKKTQEGMYDPATLLDITSSAKVSDSKSKLSVQLNFDVNLKGYTAYILTQHFYNYSACESDEDSIKLRNILTAYSDIPLAGVALDEYGNLDIKSSWLMKADEVYRGRRYTEPMAEQFKKSTGGDLVRTLFDMRFAPQDKPEIRIKAINQYMEAMCATTLKTQLAMYNMSKEIFGKNTFIGFHNTRHNALNNDEAWQTGLTWWQVKRDYGHTDEHTPLPTQLGIGMSYGKNAIYNMYYTHNLTEFVEKTLTDVRYGVRTNYLGVASSLFGLRVDSLAALNTINKVENFTRLMNYFNPSFPKIKLLVLFGMPEQLNWYPNEQKRNKFDIKAIEIEKTAQQLWDKGYLNALVPTNLIDNNTLTINAEGKPTMMGHVFDAIVFLHPEYSKKSTLDFLKTYVEKGGKLMLGGDASYSFDAEEISNQWEYIRNKAVEKTFSVAKISTLGILPNQIADGVENEDGSYTFTNKAVFNSKNQSEFSFSKLGDTFKGNYRAGAVVKINKDGDLEKLAATGFSSLYKNGKPYLVLNKEADIVYELKNGKASISIIDTSKTAKVKFFVNIN